MKSQSICRRKNKLVKLFTIVDTIPMSSYNNCLICRISSCRIFPNDSSQYEEYIRRNRPDYNVFNITDSQLQSIVYHYTKFERKVKDTISRILEKTVCLQHLQKQKEF